MTTASTRTGLSWTAWLLIALCLLIAGAAAAVWGLAHSDRAARLLGVTRTVAVPVAVGAQPAATTPQTAAPKAEPDAQRLAQLETRVSRVENATQRVEGSAGRADALLVAFAARRAIDRGVALGYLEPLLVERFGRSHPSAISTIITSSRAPVRLEELISDYEALGPVLRSGDANESWFAGVKRELASLIEVRHEGRPSEKPDARYERASAKLEAGEVGDALAETMRMPAASRAGSWIEKARRYVATHRALDEVESAALLASARPAG
jgi:hypothetical protein